MKINHSIQQMHDEVTQWRRHIHAHPETAFDEHNTSDFIAQKLTEFGIEVYRNIGETGLVGVLKVGESDKSIGLRADMDALFIQEENQFEHCSKIKGKMHACGHDGHSAMLLGTAKYLANHKNFNGTVYFIFQPAEETGDEHCGGNAMVKDGLFEHFPADWIFAMHNMPGIPAGSFAVRKGAMMASIDTFDIKIYSDHTHASAQHNTADPILTAAKVVDAFHHFKARYINPADPTILTITQFKAGDPEDRQNVHVGPSEAFVRGTVYTLNEDIRDDIQAGLSRTVEGIAASVGIKHLFNYERGYPVLNNSPEAADMAVKTARGIVGEDRVEADMKPILGAEDFSFMLKEKPGCYVFLGQDGMGSDHPPCQVHNPHYDFNDKIIPVGVQYFVNLAEGYLV